jgi:hypothetical protein
MWKTIVFVSSFLWSKIWAPLLAVILYAGFQYLLKRREERRERRKKLPTELYVPTRQQLSDAEPAIRSFQRAHAINNEIWKKARATGIAQKLGRLLGEQLRTLYEGTVPEYDAAWKALNEELDRLRSEWDTKYADIPTYAQAKDHKIVEINWWEFLTGEGPCTPLDGLREGDVVRIFNGFMTPSRFKLLDQSVEQFLTQRWNEASRNCSMRHYRDCRQRALVEIAKAIKLLDHEIEI